MYSRSTNTSIKGFTLIELMITVAIVGILSSIIVPYYSAYVQEGKNSSAVTAMAIFATRMESHFMDYRHYGLPNDRANKTCGVTTIDTEDFAITCSTITNSENYQLEATDGKHTYTFQDNGSRKTTKFLKVSASELATNSCWLKNATSCY